MKQLTAFIGVIALLLVGVISPHVSYAQSSVDGGTNYSAPSAGTGNGTTTTDTNTSSTNDQNSGFDWRWLLPLLAIPVIYFATRHGDTEDRRDYRNQNVAGAKGGRRDRSQDLDA